jgi:hypothetical protein
MLLFFFIFTVLLFYFDIIATSCIWGNNSDSWIDVGIEPKPWSGVGISTHIRVVWR